MHEPTELGTIVLLSNGDALLLVNPKWPFRWRNITRERWQEWSEVSDLVPTIVRHGYTPPPPPTPEPTLPHAVVRDAEGDVMVGVDGGWYLSRDEVFPWRELAQPVEILFPGVSDA
jgi:hypothetical protein